MDKATLPTVRTLAVLLGSIVVVLTGIIVMLLLRPSVQVVTNYAQCKQAGGALLEIYPEQCLVAGTMFVNKAQTGDGSYVGMTEKDALEKAELEKTPARVVERDNEALPVTMDFSFGRHNFFVKNGTVYKVEVEGQGTDLPLQE